MKGIFKIQGKISIKETGEGISNLVVHALDVDFSVSKKNGTSAEVKLDNSLLYDSLGSVFTDEKGNFTLEFDKDDFSSVNQEDLRPELLLHVTRPEDSDELKASFESRILYTSNPIRFKAGKIESYLIRIPEKELDKFNLNPKGANAIIQKNSSKAEKNKAIIDFKKEINANIKLKVDNAFANFSFSKLPEHIQSSKYYFKEGDNLEEKQKTIINDKLSAIASIDSSIINKKITLSFSESELIHLNLWNETERRPMSGSIPKAEVDEIVRTNSLERRTVKNCVKEFTEADLESVSNPPIPVENTETHEEIINSTIREQIQMQLTSATSPETALKYEKVIDQNYKNKNVCESVNQFALCGGPADVTAYHDFQSLEIAFEHVWTELFDEEILNYGKTLFEKIIKLDQGYDEIKQIEESRTSQVVDSNRASDAKPGRVVVTPSGGNQHPPVIPDEIINRSVSTVNDLSSLITEFSPEIRNNIYLKDLIDDVELRLSKKYSFSVFAPNYINYGVMYTYRQKWEPANYQVGKMLSSLPLAPKEVRKYSTKRVTTKSKNEKYLDDREFKGKTDSNSTSRAESEIIKRAQQNTSFGINAGVSGDIGPISMQANTNMNTSSEKFSQDTKKNFREAVLNATEEYRKQNKSEIEFGFKDDYTTESSGEISNPNDEITVTYLFYELQRQYDISEFLHKITPVVLVANEVPMPDEIDVDWLLTNAWILKRIILDESFLPALQNLMDSPIGDTIAIENLKRIMQKQEQIVGSLNSQIELKNNTINTLNEKLDKIANLEQAADTAKQIFDLGNSILNPLSALSSGGEAPTADKIKEFTQMSLERADKENQSIIANLKQEQSTLQQIVEKYNKETREFFDKQTAITTLKIHIKENILYYMQRIWDYEPADQRFFRLYNLDIQWFEEEGVEELIEVTPSEKRVYGKHDYISKLKNRIRHFPTTRKLIEVADLDKILGYKGNYMIFPVKEISYLHAYMMQEFIDNATNGIKDADEFANYTTQDLIDYLKCVKTNNPESYETEKDFVIALINERLHSTRKEKERVIIPTNSVFIEALPGKHPIMEDFKLAHRGLDVKKVQAEVRHAELENLRLAARLIEGEREDPDIEKKIIIEGNTSMVPPTE